MIRNVRIDLTPAQERAFQEMHGVKPTRKAIDAVARKAVGLSPVAAAPARRRRRRRR